jgi:cytochrome P450
MIKFNAYNSAVYRFSPILDKIMPYIIPRKVAKGGERHVLESKRKILTRMEKEKTMEAEGKRDFCSYIFEKREELKITDWSLAAHSQALIIAGSETSATVLSGLTYWLCRTPDVYETLKREVRRGLRGVTRLRA